MTEENADKVTPEIMKLERDIIMMNVESLVSEASDHEAISPEVNELETGETMINAEATANGTSDSKVIAPGDVMLKTGEMMIDNAESTETPANVASDSELYPRYMERGTVDEEETAQLEVSYDSSFKEEGNSSRGKSDISEDISPTKKLDTANGQLRKKPTLVVVGSNHKFNVRSRYLSDAVGSCHDFCKFGHKHESEKKTRRLTLGTIRVSQPLIKRTGDERERSGLEKMTMKKDLHRRLSLPGTIPDKAPLMHPEEKNLPKDMKSNMKHVQTERKPPSVQSPKASSSTKTATQAVIRIEAKSPNLQKTSTNKLKEVKVRQEVGINSDVEMDVNEKEPFCSSLEASLNKDSNQDVNEIKAKKPMRDSPKTTSRSGYSKGLNDIKAKEPMSNILKAPLKRSPSFKARLYKNRKSSSNSRNQINFGESKVDGHDGIVETNPNMEPAEKASEATVYGENSQHSLREARARKSQGSKGVRKGVGASSSSLSLRESSKPHGEKLGSGMTKSKLICLKTERSGSKTSTPIAQLTATNRLKSSEFQKTKQNGVMRDDSRSTASSSRQKSTVEQKKKPRRKEKSNVEEKDAAAWKVKFKRGTVVALQVANNAPKRLQFRRAKTLSEDQIAKAEIDRQLKNEHVKGNETHDKIGPEKVQLRHQEASGKKDDVDLNNVIEETASKLVKTRKSKVKALVGAFETVMSLGDRKRLVAG